MSGECSTDKIIFISAQALTSNSGTEAKVTTRWDTGVVLVNVSLATGTKPIVIKLRFWVSDDTGSDWYEHQDYLGGVVIRAAGKYAYPIHDIADKMKVTWEVYGTSASFTTALAMIVKS